MAIPPVRYTYTFNSVNAANHSLESYTIRIRDNQLPNDFNLDFKSGKDGFRIEYPTLDNEPQDIILGSSCTIPFIVEDAAGLGFLDLLINTQEGRFFIEIEQERDIIWRGVVVQDQLQHENRDLPFMVDIKAIDGLGQLKDKLVQDVDRGFTLLERVVSILNQAETSSLFGDDDPFVVSNMRWYEDSMLANIDPIANMSYYSEEIDYTTEGNSPQQVLSTSLDVLTNLLYPLNVRVGMLNGSWHLIQYNSYKAESITTFTYSKLYERTTIDPQDNPVGVIAENQSININRTLDNNLSIAPGVYTQAAGALVEYIGALNTVKVGFDTEIGETTVIADMSNYYDTGINLVSDPDLNVRIDNVLQATFEDSPGSQSSYNLGFTLDVEIRVLIAGTTYYLNSNNAWVTTQAVYLGTTLQGNLPGPYNDPTLDVTNLFRWNLSFVFPPPPLQGGELTMKWDLKLVSGGGSNGVILANSKRTKSTVYYEPLNGAQQPSRVNYESTNQLITTSSIDLQLNDIIIADQMTSKNRSRAWRVWDGNNFIFSNQWQLEALGTSYKIGSLLTTEIMKNRKTPNKKFEGSIHGDYLPLYSFDYNESRYVFNGGTLIGSIGYWEATFLEITYTDGNTTTSDDEVGDDSSDPTLSITNNTLGINGRVRWRETYEEGATYLQNDQVKDGNSIFIANKQTTETPSAESVDWDILILSTNIDENPFSYYIEDNQVNAKIKSDLFSINPQTSMFIFDSNYNLVENPLINEDAFFVRVGDDIILKDL